MDQKQMFAMKLKDIVKAGEVNLNIPMKEHTYFKVGGPADIFVSPSTVEELKGVINLCREENMPFMVIGNGSNLLVKDGGIRGTVIKLSALNNIEVNGLEITAESGALLTDVSKIALKHSQCPNKN